VEGVAVSSLQAGTWPVVAVLTNLSDTPGLADPGALLAVRLRCAERGFRQGAEYPPSTPPEGVQVPPGGSLRVPLDLLQLVRMRPELEPGTYRVRLVWAVGKEVAHSVPVDLLLGP